MYIYRLIKKNSKYPGFFFDIIKRIYETLNSNVIINSNVYGGIPNSRVNNVLDSDIEVKEFKLQTL